MEADAASAIDMMSLFDQSWRLHQAKYPLPPEYLASAEKIAADVFRNTNFPLPPLRLVVQFLYDRWFERRPYVAPDLNTFSRELRVQFCSLQMFPYRIRKMGNAGSGSQNNASTSGSEFNFATLNREGEKAFLSLCWALVREKKAKKMKNLVASKPAERSNTSERDDSAAAPETNANDTTSISTSNTNTSESAANANVTEREVTVKAKAPAATAPESEADKVFHRLNWAHKHLDRAYKSKNPATSTYSYAFMTRVHGKLPPTWMAVLGFTVHHMSHFELELFGIACHYFNLGAFIDEFNKCAAKLKALGELEKRVNGRKYIEHIGPLCEYISRLDCSNETILTRRTGAKCSIHHPSGHCILTHKCFLGDGGKCELPTLDIECPECKAENEPKKKNKKKNKKKKNKNKNVAH
jgi:hypothetical protein